jgi:hypothetical protein
MEKLMSKGLALEELEGLSYAELLPDRIEMRRGNRRSKRRRSGNVECKVTNVAGLFNGLPDDPVQNFQICQRINA